MSYNDLEHRLNIHKGLLNRIGELFRAKQNLNNYDVHTGKQYTKRNKEYKTMKKEYKKNKGTDYYDQY